MRIIQQWMYVRLELKEDTRMNLFEVKFLFCGDVLLHFSNLYYYYYYYIIKSVQLILTNFGTSCDNKCFLQFYLPILSLIYLKV